ncbi:MAG: transglycosylase domain-containing protein [Lachnospiraceae bacterium]
MNYGKYSINKQQKFLRSKKRRIASLIRVTAIRLTLLALVFVLLVSCFAAYGVYRGVVSKSPSLDSINVVPTSYASTIYYSDGVTVAKTLASSGSNREYVTYKNISEHAINAFIALEDERFWNHNGIDIQGIFRVAFTDLLTGKEHGASTITQQLIKNQVFEGGNESLFTDKLKRKIQEQYLAIQLETYTPKEKIIEYYLNTINLGNGSYGIQKASQEYFGKDASELTVSEAAVLAPIAYSPTGMNPINYPESNKIRRQATLDNMYEQNLITKQQYDEAIADTDSIYERILIQSQQGSNYDSSTNSYFVDALITQVLADLEEMGYTSYEANALLYSGGLSIYTTQDKDIQAVLDEEFTNEANFPAVGEGSYYELSNDWAFSVYLGNDQWQHYHVKDLLEYYSEYDDTNGWYYHKSGGRKGISQLTLNKEDLDSKISAFIEAKMTENNGESYLESGRNIILQPQTAMVIMDYRTGDVLALYGGRGEKIGDRVLNRATGTYRQPGSTFKVLAAFMPAMDTGGYTLASTFDDSYYYYGTGNEAAGDDATIKNWYSSGYEGLSPIRRGIYHSMNIIAVRCLEATGISTSLSYLDQMGFSRLDDINDRNISLALGGITNGVSVLEMTAGYSTIANGGVYNKPRLYTKILDHDGKVLIDNTTKSTQIIKSSTAYLLTDAMKDTVTIGTGTKCKFKNLDIEVAGKTGTSTAENDLWFCGFTPYYCGSIWSGYDNNFEQTSTQYQKELWRICMERIHEIKSCEPAKFEVPSSVTEATICSKCGNLAVTGLCDKNEYGNLITTEYFANGTVPTQKCTCCVEVTICKDSGQMATTNCTNTYTVVLLDKLESEECLNHGGTYDTKYCLTEKMRQTCTLHSQYVPPDSDTETP